MAPIQPGAGLITTDRYAGEIRTPWYCVPLAGGHVCPMLILSRKVGQSIVINSNIVVKVVRMDGDQIKLGIQAPPEVIVHREEIQRDIDAGKPAGKPTGKPGDGASALKTILGIQE